MHAVCRLKGDKSTFSGHHGGPDSWERSDRDASEQTRKLAGIPREKPPVANLAQRAGGGWKRGRPSGPRGAASGDAPVPTSMTGSDGCVTVVGMPSFPSTILYMFTRDALENVACLMGRWHGRHLFGNGTTRPSV